MPDLKLAHAALFALALLTASCAAQSPSVVLAGQVFQVEIADTPQARERGLMYRDRLAADAGMLFIFERQEPQAFWMKNTRIPLDILYFDRDLKLVGWSLDTPPCTLGNQCPNYPSQAPAQYVLELNAGTTRKLGVQFGDTLELRLAR